jgi:hypothetical protein
MTAAAVLCSAFLTGAGAALHQQRHRSADPDD